MLGSAAAVIAVVGGLAVSRTSLLHARSIEVRTGPSVPRAQVLATAGIDRGTNVLWLDEDAAERRLESLAWVAAADVWVTLPATIHVEVTERTPVAIASDGRGEVLVAGDGTALGSPGRPSQARGLPRIELAPTDTIEGRPQGPVGAAQVLAALDPEVRAQVARITVLLDGTLDVWFRSGPMVRFGPASAIEPKARAIEHTLSWARSEGERVVSLSVVAPWAPAATLAP